MIVAKIRVKNASVVKKMMQAKIDAYLKDQKEMQAVAKVMQTQYRLNIREGFDANGKPLKGLSRATIKRRKALEDRNKTFKSYRAEKSNLTFTGELITKIFVKLADRKGTFELDFDGTHKKYKGIRKALVGTASAIYDIAIGLKKKGFNLFGFPERKKDFVSKFVVRKLRAFLRRNK